MKRDYVILRLIYETKQKITKQNKNRTKKQKTTNKRTKKNNKQTREQKQIEECVKLFYK